MTDSFTQSDPSGAVIQAAFAVQKALGQGFSRDIYKRALAIEFEEFGLRFSPEALIPVLYRNREIGQEQIDFVVEQDLIVIVKISPSLSEQDMASLQRLVDITNKECGLVVNFGGSSVQVRRATRATSENG